MVAPCFSIGGEAERMLHGKTRKSRREPTRDGNMSQPETLGATDPVHTIGPEMRERKDARYFYVFRKHFLQKYIFNITIYSFVPLPPGRGRQGFICKLKKNYLHGSPWREPAATPLGGRGPAARQGGGRLPDILPCPLCPLNVF